MIKWQRNILFSVEKQCPVCGGKTPVIKVKSRLMAERIDNDYCCHYKDFNPYLYHIWVCDKCGYAADEKNFFWPLCQIAKKEALVKFLHKHKVHFEFHDVRSIPDGLASLQLAIYCAEAMGAPIARRAGMELRMAWIYRIIKDKENEKEAFDQFIAAL